jgi:hypothetical protein
MPTPAGQNIMDEGPGLRQRTRDTNAVVGEVAPQTTGKAPAAAPPQEVDKVNKKGKFGTHKGEDRNLPVDQWAKPLGSFKRGTDYVPKTGVYKLHEGEAVKTKEENKMDAFAHVPGRTEPKPAKKEIKRMEITKSHNGKHIVKHIHHHPAHEDETHVMNDMAALHSHMEDHAGTPNDGEGAESAPPESPAPMTPSPSPAGSPAAPGE